MASPAPATSGLPISLASSNLFFRISAICGAVYLLTVPWHPYPGSAIIKGLSIALLSWIAFRSGAIQLGVALALSSAGDILLDVDPRNLFIFGLGAFLIAHINYAAFFLRVRLRGQEIPRSRLGAAAAVLMYAVAFGAWLVPGLGTFAVPVALYMCAITAMVVSALFARLENRWVAGGAILFLISDSILAADRFRTPIPLSDYIVWATYYAAQFGIAAGVLDRRSAGK